MRYTSVMETAIEWDVSTTCVYRAAREGRIIGAKNVNGNWYIPEGAKNPTKKIIAPKRGYISTTEAAERCGINRMSVLNAAKDGRIPGAEFIGGRWHIPYDFVRPLNKKTDRLLGYASIRKTAEKWGVSYSFVASAVKEGRIAGVKQVDGKWNIPEEATCPEKRKRRL